MPGSQGLFSPRWSPDGRYLAASSSDMTRLFLYSLKAGRWKQIILPASLRSGQMDCEAWSHDSRYLFFAMGGSIIQTPDTGRAASTRYRDSIAPYGSRARLGMSAFG